MDITVREAIIGDSAALADIHVKAWQVAYVSYMDKEFLQGMSVSKREDQWKRILENPSEGKYLVALSKDTVKAFAVYGPPRDQDIDKKTAELVALNVHPEQWRRNFGTILLQAVLKRTRELGYTGIYLWVIEGNEAAINLYEKHGFTNSNIRKTSSKHSGNPIDEIRFYTSLV